MIDFNTFFNNIISQEIEATNGIDVTPANVVASMQAAFEFDSNNVIGTKLFSQVFSNSEQLSSKIESYQPEEQEFVGNVFKYITPKNEDEQKTLTAEREKVKEAVKRIIYGKENNTLEKFLKNFQDKDKNDVYFIAKKCLKRRKYLGYEKKELQQILNKQNILLDYEKKLSELRTELEILKNDKKNKVEDLISVQKSIEDMSNENLYDKALEETYEQILKKTGLGYAEFQKMPYEKRKNIFKDYGFDEIFNNKYNAFLKSKTEDNRLDNLYEKRNQLRKEEEDLIEKIREKNDEIKKYRKESIKTFIDNKIELDDKNIPKEVANQEEKKFIEEVIKNYVKDENEKTKKEKELNYIDSLVSSLVTTYQISKPVYIKPQRTITKTTFDRGYFRRQHEKNDQLTKKITYIQKGLDETFDKMSNDMQFGKLFAFDTQGQKWLRFKKFLSLFFFVLGKQVDLKDNLDNEEYKSEEDEITAYKNLYKKLYNKFNELKMKDFIGSSFFIKDGNNVVTCAFDFCKWIVQKNVGSFFKGLDTRSEEKNMSKILDINILYDKIINNVDNFIHNMNGKQYFFDSGKNTDMVKFVDHVKKNHDNNFYNLNFIQFSFFLMQFLQRYMHYMEEFKQIDEKQNVFQNGEQKTVKRRKG